MEHPEGSNPHELAIQTTFSALEKHGWAVMRVRNKNIPLVAIKGRRLRIGGHAAHDWNPAGLAAMVPEDVEIATVGHESDHLDKRRMPMTDFEAAIQADLQAARQEWERDGWKVIFQRYIKENGYAGCVQPDGIAATNGELWAIEATSARRLRHRVRRYVAYDGVACAVFAPGQVVRDDLTLEMFIELWRQGEPWRRLDGVPVKQRPSLPDVACPYCQADPSAPCVAVQTGVEVPVHAARLRVGAT